MAKHIIHYPESEMEMKAEVAMPSEYRPTISVDLPKEIAATLKVEDVVELVVKGKVQEIGTWSEEDRYHLRLAMDEVAIDVPNEFEQMADD